MRRPLPVSRGDAFELKEFLLAADLSVDGIGEPEVHVWVDLDADGRIVGSTGFELDGQDALLRGIAVHSTLADTGRRIELARFALDRATSIGATRAWLLGRRAGALWQQLGFEPANIADLEEALASTHPVRSLAASSQLAYQTAWSRPLP
jgi:N-acetylglutamate synthase-like GNAT family acetyltransferase